MVAALEEPHPYTGLRDRAESHLRTGTAPKAGSWTMGIDVLRLLHDLSSNPDRADEALKLLHELQVHQVELDLQNEQIVANEQALSDDLRLWMALYDQAPIAYLVVEPDGAVVQGNLAAGELFDVDTESLAGQRLAPFLSPASRPRLLDLLQRVAESHSRDSCPAETAGGTRGCRSLELVASRHPEREQILLACCERGNGQ